MIRQIAPRCPGSQDSKRYDLLWLMLPGMALKNDAKWERYVDDAAGKGGPQMGLQFRSGFLSGMMQLVSMFST